MSEGTNESRDAAIEVFADIWCPFAHVGLRAVVAQRARLGRTDVPLLVRAWPLELVNARPLDPSTTAQHIADLRQQVAAHLFVGFDVTTFPHSSIEALGLASVAYRIDASTGEAVTLALRDALFEEGLDISSRAVLTSVAFAHGLEYSPGHGLEAVLADWSDGQRRAVRGSPHFFCRGDEAFCPVLDITRDERGHLFVQRTTEMLNRFLETCLNG